MSKFSDSLFKASDQVLNTMPWVGALLGEAAVEVKDLEDELVDIKERLDRVEKNFESVTVTFNSELRNEPFHRTVQY